ncbi:hypothetical protein SKUN_00995 [Spiroplasma kunkelii CR2-3x]|uniref:Transmembrane protein n=1 Tax=Spiroplasma kunkelii CR2-3x TaxID=273035 RepID=A0A0K2JI28_SPIKU|nr:hypothetical protein SKUN_00995 [Spiroplasma kunkelii CR2-3x]
MSVVYKRIALLGIKLLGIAVILINSRTMQSIVTTILTILFVGGSFLFVTFIPALFGAHYKEAILSIKGLSISCGVMLGLVFFNWSLNMANCSNFSLR